VNIYVQLAELSINGQTIARAPGFKQTLVISRTANADGILNFVDELKLS
jgi:hypothetical protein